MLSWFSKHRPKRRKPQTAGPAPAPAQTSDEKSGLRTSLRRGSLLFRPRRQDTDATLVDTADTDSTVCSLKDSDEYAAGKEIPVRCASPDPFDSPPPSPLSKTLTLSLHNDVPFDCEPTVKAHRSKLSKAVVGVASSVGAILEASIVVGEAANIPLLKGVAGIILLLANSVEATEANKTDCTRLSKMVLELASVAARHAERQEHRHQLSYALDHLGQAFSRILHVLQVRSKRSYARRLIEADNDRDLILECEKELQYFLDIFQIKSSISMSVAVKRKDTAGESFERQISDVMSPVKALLPTESVSEPVVEIPPAPQIFHGRSAELEILVKMFASTEQAHAVILGQIGAGKSALARVLMHHAEIVTTFANRRFLVECKMLKTAVDVVSQLASLLNVSSDAKAVRAKLSALPASFIVFDDLDAVWDSEAKLEVEDFLTDLSTISSVSLVLTLRGAQRPLGPAYKKPYLPPLGSLSPIAAQNTLTDIADTWDDDADELLSLVGYLPLPTVLLAQMAQCEPVSFLLDRFREEGMAIFAETDLERILNEALDSPRIREFPVARDVLEILARRPEGVRKADVAALVTREVRIPVALVNKCLSTLHKTSLVVQDGSEQLRVPEIVRAYLLDQNRDWL